LGEEFSGLPRPTVTEPVPKFESSRESDICFGASFGDASDVVGVGWRLVTIFLLPEISGSYILYLRI
jgi:hypothetical protein